MHDPEKTEPSLPGSRVTWHPSVSPQTFTEDAEGGKDSMGPAARPLWLGAGDQRGRRRHRGTQDPPQGMTPPPGPGSSLGGWDPGFGDGALVCGPGRPFHIQRTGPLLIAKETEAQRVTGLVQGRMARAWQAGLWPAQGLRRSLCGRQWRQQAHGRPRPSGGLWCRSPGTRRGGHLQAAPKCLTPSPDGRPTAAFPDLWPGRTPRRGGGGPSPASACARCSPAAAGD